jgi:predicted anti-sigma-YlaC factor YlaD
MRSISLRQKLCSLLLLLALLPACSIRKSAFKTIGSALSGAADEFARDEDPELVRGAIPFSLKVMETVLKEDPKNATLISGLAKGFVSFSYGFILQDADELDDKDKVAAKAARDRATKLFLRGRDYGMKYFALKNPNFAADLKANPKKAVQSATKADVPMLFWTALGWAGALSTSRDFMMLPQIPQFEAMLERALELDEAYDSGSIHSFYITYEMAKLTAKADKATLAKKHFDRAMELAGGKQAGPLVSYAESVLVPAKNRAEFESTLRQALKVDVNSAPDSRVLNLILQKRARWLLNRADKLFAAR